jgi:hypothetical protein
MCSSGYVQIKYNNSRFIFDKQKKILMCEISKSGCTSLKLYWISIKNKSLSCLSGNEMHGASTLGSVGLFYGFSWNETYVNYHKFIVVRHPLDRLLSAYYNMIHYQEGEPGPLETMPDILLQFDEELHGDIRNLSFNQFVEYIANPKSKFYNDRHWIPYTKTCLICEVEYDHIFRLETLDAEFDMFKEGIQASKELSLEIPNLNLHKRPKNRSVVLEEYKALPLGLMYKVLDRYSNDMKVFGYGFNMHYYATTCDMKGCC